MKSASRKVSIVLPLLMLFEWGGLVSSQGQVPQSFIIEGIVMDDFTNQPIMGVDIRRPVPPPPPEAPPPPSDDTTPVPGREPVFTGADGRFVLENVRVSGLVDFRRPGYETKQIRVMFPEVARVSNVVVRLRPLGTISGVVLSSDGKPAAGIAVTPYSIEPGPYRSGRVLAPGRLALTDDRGEFRLYDLKLASYLLGYGPLAYAEGASTLDRGPGPVLYPGVSNVSEADVIELSSSAGVNVTLRPVVLGLRQLGSIRVHIPNPASAKDIEMGLRPTWGPGNPTLPPGVDRPRYPEQTKRRIEAGETIQQTYLPNAPLHFMMLVYWTTATGRSARLITPVAYTGADVDLSLVLTEPSGNLEIFAQVEGPDGLVPLSSARLVLCRRTPGIDCHQSEFWVYNDQFQTVLPGLDKQGKVVLADIPQGQYDLYSIPVGAGLYVASVSQGDRDVLEDGILVSNEPTVVNIRVRSGATRLYGSVINEDGQQLANATVRLLPVSNSRLLSLRREVKTDYKGEFDMTSVPPGQYQVYAWPDNEDSNYTDADLSSVDGGRLVSLVENSEMTVRVTALISKRK